MINNHSAQSKNKRSYIPDKDKKFLWGRSGNRCAFPECRVELAKEGSSGNKVIIGEMAHIKGENPTSARYDPNMCEKDRNGYENRILLCPTHHTLIDNDDQTYIAEKLFEMKREHEKMVRESLKKEEIKITFAELEVITKFLVSANTQREDEITLIPPKEKIQKNQLSADIEENIKIGMLKSKLVAQYIEKQPDVDFGERLKKGFVDKYLKLKKAGVGSDELFWDLFEFASNGSPDFKTRAAGLAILTYFFETCEVFEK